MPNLHLERFYGIHIEIIDVLLTIIQHCLRSWRDDHQYHSPAKIATTCAFLEVIHLHITSFAKMTFKPKKSFAKF